MIGDIFQMQLQFELWQECNSKCKFCYLDGDNNCTPEYIKLNSMTNAYNMISNMSNYPKIDTLSYLGGEFFQGQINTPKVRELFFKLMERTAYLLNNGFIKNVWIYATMTVGEQKDLYDTLKLFKTKKGFWILTSYDTQYRFHSQKMLDNWNYHMLNIQKLYPDIMFNITTILSSHFINQYMNDNFRIEEFMKKYHSTFFFKQPGSGIMSKEDFEKKVPGFFPTRCQFLEFLKLFKTRESDENWTKLFNIKCRSDLLYRNFNDMDHQMQLSVRHKDQALEEEVINPDLQINKKCGHLMNYSCYIDSDKCCLCDKKLIDSLG